MESYIHLYETNDEFTAAYNGPDYKEPWLSLTEENMTIGYNKPKLTAITFDSITWVTDIPATGGTATKDNCKFKVYGKYNNGISVDISSDATVTGELAVPSSTEDTRQSVGTLTLTASYGDFTATGNVTVYQEAAVPDFSTKPLTFKISSPGTINWTATDSSLTKTIEYKLNDSHNWASITSNTGSSAPSIEVNPGDKIQFRGDNTAYCGDNPDLCSTFSGSTAKFEVEGNIMSLINSTNFTTATTLESNFTFAGLFGDCTGLTSAENLILPATTLAIGCYFTMFDGCTSLTTAPKLPATTLAMGCYVSMFQGCTSLTTAPTLPVTSLAMVCYQYMFQGCSSLTSAPELPATALTEACYVSMFNGCTSLTTAPALPATTLANDCYKSMFQNCTSLTTAPALPATALTEACYVSMFNGCASLTTAPALPATTLANDCYKYMFNGCTSLTTAPSILPANTLAGYCYNGMFKGCTSLTTAPELPATTLADNCYLDMFYGCTSLTTAPELPATTLADYCYTGMFYNCTNLNYIECLAEDISAYDCTSYWVNGVASTGTFVKAASMTGWTTGNSGIPSGWAVEDNQEPLTFNILSAGTINWTASNTDITKTIDYKVNDGAWVSITSNTGSSAPSITVNSGDKIQFRGNNAQYATSYSNYNSFSGSTASFEVEGNIMSLIYGDDFKNKLTISSTYTFASLFRDCVNLVSAENLILPATSLTDGCYQYMFNGCTSLTTAPELPATTLASNCYVGMFNGCTSLTTAPELPATTLASNCYDNMFSGCKSLTTAPELPATTLANKCYNYMFRGCTLLTTAPALPATTLKDYCYYGMFSDCTSLTAAPVLPATTLEYQCYSYMFNGCTKLNCIKCLATDISASYCTSNWVNGVAATGTFVKPSSMASWGTGTSGIPTGWTVEEYIDYNKKPLTFKITSGGTIYWSTSNRSVSKTIDYKLNDGEWKSITSNTWASAPKINVNAGDKVQFKGNNTAYGAYSSRDALYNTFYGSTARFEIEGNIMSLINSENFATLITLESDYTFSYLFDDCTGLTSAENLILPATTLTSECYQYMFQNCRSLTTAPKLPAKTLGYLCYGGMFNGCASLTTAPALPATELKGSCYEGMFQGCASLTTAPKLPAKTLERYCYMQMFYNCVSLTVAPELPAAILEYGCYQYMFENCRSLNYIKCLATDISARNCRERWVSGVASTGTFVKAASMAGWYRGEDAIPKNWTVKDA